MSTGCAVFPGVGASYSPTATPANPSTTPSSSAPVGPPETIGFADGAPLDPLAQVGWTFTLLPAGGAWTPNPDNPPGETSYV